MCQDFVAHLLTQVGLVINNLVIKHVNMALCVYSFTEVGSNELLK